MTYREVVEKMVEQRILHFLWDVENTRGLSFATDIKNIRFAQKKDFLTFKAEVRITNFGKGGWTILFPRKRFEFHGVVTDEAKVLLTSIDDDKDHKTYLTMLSSEDTSDCTHVGHLQEFWEAI